MKDIQIFSKSHLLSTALVHGGAYIIIASQSYFSLFRLVYYFFQSSASSFIIRSLNAYFIFLYARVNFFLAKFTEQVFNTL